MMRSKSLKTTNLFLVVLAIITVMGCKQKPAENNGKRESQGGIPLGGILSVNEPSKPESLHPSYIDGPSVSHIAAQIYDGLLKYNPETLEPALNLADEAKLDETKTICTFSLKKGVYFHADPCFGGEGREITAKDVKFSFELLCQPAENDKAFERSFKDRVVGANEYHEGKAKEVTGIKVIDDYTVEITLVKPYKAFLYLLVSPITPIVPREAIEKYGKDAHVGSGPFIYFEEGDKVVLRRNKGYHLTDVYGNQLPYLDQVNISFIPNKDKELEAFFAGKLDIITGLNINPIRDMIDEHIKEFEGENAKYVMQASSDIAENDVYYLYRKSVNGFSENFMNHRDYSTVYIRTNYSEFVE